MGKIRGSGERLILWSLVSAVERETEKDKNGRVRECRQRQKEKRKRTGKKWMRRKREGERREK